MKRSYNILQYILLSIILIMVVSMVYDCSDNRKQYLVGVSLCADKEWYGKLHRELEVMGYISDSINVKIKSANADSKMQIAQIDSFINMGVQLLIVAPNKENDIDAAIEKAYKSGIPVILYERKIKSDNYTAFIGCDNYKIGYNMGKHIANELKGKGRIVEIMGRKGSTPTIARARGFEDALKTFPDMHIVYREHATWKQDLAGKAMARALQQTKDIDYVFAQSDIMAYGAYLAAKKAVPDNKIKFAGVDGVIGVTGETRGIDLVREGILNASYLNPTSGDEVIKIATNILHGKKVKKENDLAASILTPDNVGLTLIAARTADRKMNILTALHRQVDKYEKYNEKKNLWIWLLALCLASILLAAVSIYRSYQTKNRLYLQIARKNDELEKLNKEVMELTNSRLNFFTNVSHELRTPLTLILDPMERILADKALGGKTRYLLNIVNRNALMLKHLVDDIMDFRKVQAGKMRLNLTQFDLAERLREQTDAFYPSAEKKNITIEIDTSRFTHKHITADEDKISRITGNLLANAVKYTPVGGRIFVMLSDAPDGRALISVKDTGIGISEEDCKKVFDRFYQVLGNMGGTGIGLAVVKEYAELHHGEASVVSRIGEGADFRVIIPCSQDGLSPAATPDSISAPAYATVSPDRIDDSNARLANDTIGYTSVVGNTSADSEVPSAHGDSPADGPTDIEKSKLLVIDDNIDIREYIRATFADEYDIMESGNGKEGLEMAVKYVPDIVVSDVMMPQMNGMDFCSALKQNPATCHIPVILLTAKVLDDQKIEGYEHGADSYITKPFNSIILRARMENLINSRKMLRSLFAAAATGSTQVKDNAAPIKDNAVKDQDNAATVKDAAVENVTAASGKNDKDAAGKSDTTTAPASPVVNSVAGGVSETDRKFIAQLRRIVEENMADTDFGVEEISGEMGLSRVQLYRKVKAITGMTVVDLLRKARLNHAHNLLRETDKSISEIAYEVGFSSPSYFTKCYKDEFNILPGDTRNAPQTAENG